MRARTVALFALFASLAIACGGDAEESSPGVPSPASEGALASRLLRIGEDLGTTVDGLSEALPRDLQVALNPNAVLAIDSAVREADSRLETVARAAGMTSEAFVALWNADRVAAFSRFAAGADTPLDEGDAAGITPLEDLFLDELVALPVHPDGVLVGSVRFLRPDGVILYFIAYDVTAADAVVEDLISQQLDRTPWQVTSGQSTPDLAVVAFQSTVNGSIRGSAIVQQLPAVSPDEAGAQSDGAGAGDDADGPQTASGGSLTSVVYIVEIQALDPADEPAFVLPPSRPLPVDFPAPALIFDDETVLAISWDSGPGIASYRLTLLTPKSTFDVVDAYREAIPAAGWDLLDDRADGFATVLDFGLADGTVTGTLSVDVFAADDSYTAVFLQLQTTSRPAGN